jgi:hydroxymethylbilane synthase
MDKTITIGARGSDLAQVQVRWVSSILEKAGLRLNSIIIKTHGDRVIDRPLADLGIQGVFTKEIEEAMLRGEIDLAVHSFKDVPIERPEGLKIVAITEREDPADLLIINQNEYDSDGDIFPLKPNATVGTSAIRRARQILALRNDVVIKDLRGNVPTRLEKLANREYSAIFLASAGVARLGLDLSEFQVERLEPTAFIPSPGQGALAIEMRVGDARIKQISELLNDSLTAISTEIERGLLAKMGGGCTLPLGAYAENEEGIWTLHCFWGDDISNPVWRTASNTDPSELISTVIASL